jgi:hypothetical protein
MSKVRVHTFRPLTDDERGLILALARVLPIHSFWAMFTAPQHH